MEERMLAMNCYVFCKIFINIKADIDSYACIA